MRSVVIFVSGLLVGLAVNVATAQSSAAGVEMMNHVGVTVPNVTDAVQYYAQKMGYTEAFRVTNPQGQPTLVYMQISKNTFLELNQQVGQAPIGFTHYGLVVTNAANAVRDFKARGVTVTETNVSAGTKAILANITDPYMGRIELVQITPESLHRKAIDGWK